MFAGVFERFPDLQFVFSETGCAWIAAELQILDGAVRDGQDQGARPRTRSTTARSRA